MYGPGWQDLCISVLPRGAEVPSFEAIDRASRAADECFDCMRYDEISYARRLLGSHDAEVHLALGTGGIGHKERRPELLAIFPLDNDVVVARGEFGASHDAEILLGIISTISGR